MSILIEGTHSGGPGTGSLGGPPSGHVRVFSSGAGSSRVIVPDPGDARANYKRAVYRQAPKEFTVEVLPPMKFGSSHCFGMRIFPVETSDVLDSRSTKSGSSWSQEYDVWRRWEDCLWFQEILEGEYALMARQKRTRLAAGKGVKKNGVYIHSDHAASFESLPPGPDAKTIAKDIHEYIPRLTKKGTLFRASQATVDQRAREFSALVYALWEDDVPMLVRELRETKLIRDFFGFWRRDQDHERKRLSAAAGAGNASFKSGVASVRNSVSSSAFSMYFSASTLSLALPANEVPPSPALPTFQTREQAQSPQSASPRQMTFRRDDLRRRSARAAPPVSFPYAQVQAQDTSAGAGEPQSPAESAPGDHANAQDLTFYVTARGSLALDAASPRASTSTSVSSSSTSTGAFAARRSFPLAELGQEEVPSSDGEYASFVSASASMPMPISTSPGGLQALPEGSELVSLSMSPRSPLSATSNSSTGTGGGAYYSDVEEGGVRVRIRRARNNSCPDRSNRQCLFLGDDAPRSAHFSMSLGAGGGGAFSMLEQLRRDTQRLQAASTSASASGYVQPQQEGDEEGEHDDNELELQHDGEDDPPLSTPTHSGSGSGSGSSRTSSSSAAFSHFSGASTARSSWRTSMTSERSMARSFATGFSGGACADAYHDDDPAAAFDSALSLPLSYASFADSCLAPSLSYGGRDKDADRDNNRLSVASAYSTATFASTASTSTSGRRTALARRLSMETLNSVVSDSTIDSCILPPGFGPDAGWRFGEREARERAREGAALRRSLSAGSRRPVSIMAALDTHGQGIAHKHGQENYWDEQQEDLIDAYFYDPAIHAPAFEEPPRTPPPAPAPMHPHANPNPNPSPNPNWAPNPLQRAPSKEISTPDRFPKPFQHRPPGQFHLPWAPSPPPPSAPPLSVSPSSLAAQTPTPTETAARAPSHAAGTGTGTAESITLKAVLHESIVLLRAPRTAPLEDVRARLRDKFAAQEGVLLSRAFVVGCAAPAPAAMGVGAAGRPRANSASSMGTLNPAALRYVYTEAEWRAAVEACVGGKMTVRLFNTQPL